MLLAGPRVDPVIVENALHEVLSSQYFRSSAQCSSLLRYIVQNTLAERDEHLRERVIGAEVFGRAPDYDTGNDHIVRSRASEVRKRLAQYYQGSLDAGDLRIGIPSGSYRATFDIVQSPSTPNPLDRRFAPAVPEADGAAELFQRPAGSADGRAGPGDSRVVPDTPGATPLVRAPRSWLRRPKRSFIAAVLFVFLCAALGLSLTMWSVAQESAFDKFWKPLKKSTKPVLIYCGGGFVYKLSDSFLDDYRLKRGMKGMRREFFVDLKPGEFVPSQDLVPDEHFVPFGDLASTARMVTTLSLLKKTYDVRYGEDLAFTEFRTSPVILIGGLNNSWALKVTHNLRYVLDQDDRIVDQWHRDRVWTQTADPDNQARDDYAIISRLNASDNGTGEFILSVAGIRMYGTRAAAELVSDPARLNQILKGLPRGWEAKNLQVVLHTKTMNEIPILVNVEAIYSW